jgi:hypothetical protein
METNNRYQRGWEKLKEIDGEAGGRHRRRSAHHRFIHRHDRARRPQLAGAALLWSARLSRRGVRRRVAVAVDLKKQQGGSGMSA